MRKSYLIYPIRGLMGLERNDATIRESDRGYCRLDATFLPSQILWKRRCRLRLDGVRRLHHRIPVSVEGEMPMEKEFLALQTDDVPVAREERPLVAQDCMML